MPANQNSFNEIRICLNKFTLRKVLYHMVSVNLCEQFKCKTRYINCYQFEIFVIKAEEKTKLTKLNYNYLLYFLSIHSKICVVMYCVRHH